MPCGDTQHQRNTDMHNGLPKHDKQPATLSAASVKNVNVPGYYNGGLRLSQRAKPVWRRGYCKFWAWGIRIDSHMTTIGLGAFPTSTLTIAREWALENAGAVVPENALRRV